jgi:hypothetical protein
MNIELHNFISCRSELLVISTDTVAVSSGSDRGLVHAAALDERSTGTVSVLRAKQRCGQAPTEVFEGVKAPRRRT